MARVGTGVHCTLGTAIGRFSLVRVLSFGYYKESLAVLDAETMKKVRAIYDRHIRDLVHHCW